MEFKVMNKYLESMMNACGSVKSTIYLRILSFTESIFFPIPTDALLAPMVISGKHNWVSITLSATIWSVLGGIVGYYLGFYLYDNIEPVIHDLGKYDQYLAAKNYFQIYGIIFLFIAAFTPIPYKVFTISAGVLNYNIILFILISLFGRGARFFLVSFICLKYGQYMLAIINKYLLLISILILLLLGIALWV
tara:strand:+ start:2591 stop:3166 length:576 start_codon:yes stop_codon:yes gene_type:complete